MREVLLFVAVPIVVDTVGLGVSCCAVAESVEIVGAVDAELAGQREGVVEVVFDIEHGLVGGAVLRGVEGVGGVGVEGDGVDGALGSEDVRLGSVGADELNLSVEGELASGEGSAEGEDDDACHSGGGKPEPRFGAQEGGEEAVKGH